MTEANVYMCIDAYTTGCIWYCIWYAEQIWLVYVVKGIHEFALVAVCRPHYDGLLLCFVWFVGVNRMD